jgi:hypothetical protein
MTAESIDISRRICSVLRSVALMARQVEVPLIGIENVTAVDNVIVGDC